ncbi:Fungal specific zinc-finger transcription factor [Pseudozyma hubeiensis]|nr:Fungal specific zinc-finger transcription factor [Pseudozyma hubeiensis]
MMIKFTAAFVVAAAVLSTTAKAALQCSKQTFSSNIIQVEVFSAADLSDTTVNEADAPWADVILTEKYFSDVGEAHHYINMRHNAIDCRQVKGAMNSICNINYVAEEPGNTCAQVTHKSHRLGWGTGKALDISESAPNSPVHFRATLAPSLQSWTAGLPDTCATQTFDAPDKGYKVVTFHASERHEWNPVVVTLDEPDHLFGNSWSCSFDEYLHADAPRGTTLDGGKTWSFTHVRFDPVVYSAQ